MKEERINWIIFAVCVFITAICFANTGLLFNVNQNDIGDVNIDETYLKFVKWTNLFFGIIFLVTSVIFLFRALVVRDVGWAKKWYGKVFDRFGSSYIKQMEQFRERGRAIQAAKSKAEDLDSDIIPADRKLGRPITISSSCDKQVPAPSIVGAAPVNSRITLGEFEYKESDLMSTIRKRADVASKLKSPRRPLDDLKDYYIQQSKLKK
jgi:hypothetical protein